MIQQYVTRLRLKVLEKYNIIHSPTLEIKQILSIQLIREGWRYGPGHGPGSGHGPGPGG
jgi:hypothetical protein